MPQRPAHAPPESGPKQRRLKLIIFILILGPMVLFGIYHLVLGFYKMSQGVPVGYEQRDHRTGEIRPAGGEDATEAGSDAAEGR